MLGIFKGKAKDKGSIAKNASSAKDDKKGFLKKSKSQDKNEKENEKGKDEKNSRFTFRRSKSLDKKRTKEAQQEQIHLFSGTSTPSLLNEKEILNGITENRKILTPEENDKEDDLESESSYTISSSDITSASETTVNDSLSSASTFKSSTSSQIPYDKSSDSSLNNSMSIVSENYLQNCKTYPKRNYVFEHPFKSQFESSTASSSLYSVPTTSPYIVRKTNSQPSISESASKHYSSFTGEACTSMLSTPSSSTSSLSSITGRPISPSGRRTPPGPKLGIGGRIPPSPTTIRKTIRTNIITNLTASNRRNVPLSPSLSTNMADIGESGISPVLLFERDFKNNTKLSELSKSTPNFSKPNINIRQPDEQSSESEDSLQSPPQSPSPSIGRMRHSVSSMQSLQSIPEIETDLSGEANEKSLTTPRKKSSRNPSSKINCHNNKGILFKENINKSNIIVGLNRDAMPFSKENQEIICTEENSGLVINGINHASSILQMEPSAVQIVTKKPPLVLKKSKDIVKHTQVKEHNDTPKIKLTVTGDSSENMTVDKSITNLGDFKMKREIKETLNEGTSKKENSTISNKDSKVNYMHKTNNKIQNIRKDSCNVKENKYDIGNNESATHAIFRIPFSSSINDKSCIKRAVSLEIIPNSQIKLSKKNETFPRSSSSVKSIPRRRSISMPKMHHPVKRESNVKFEIPISLQELKNQAESFSKSLKIDNQESCPLVSKFVIQNRQNSSNPLRASQTELDQQYKGKPDNTRTVDVLNKKVVNLKSLKNDDNQLNSSLPLEANIGSSETKETEPELTSKQNCIPESIFNIDKECEKEVEESETANDSSELQKSENEQQTEDEGTEIEEDLDDNEGVVEGEILLKTKGTEMTPETVGVKGKNEGMGEFEETIEGIKNEEKRKQENPKEKQKCQPINPIRPHHTVNPVSPKTKKPNSQRKTVEEISETDSGHDNSDSQMVIQETLRIQIDEKTCDKGPNSGSVFVRDSRKGFRNTSSQTEMEALGDKEATFDAIKKELGEQEQKYQNHIDDLTLKLASKQQEVADIANQLTSAREASSNNVNEVALQIEVEDMKKMVKLKEDMAESIKVELQYAKNENEISKMKIQRLDEDLSQTKDLVNSLQDQNNASTMEISSLKELESKVKHLEEELRKGDVTRKDLQETIDEIEGEREDELKIVQDALDEAAQEREELILTFEKELNQVNETNSGREAKMLEDFEWKLSEMEKGHKKRLEEKERQMENTLQRVNKHADGEETRQKMEKQKNEINAKWEDKLRSECSRLKAELDDLHSEEKHLAVESIKVQKEQEIHSLKTSWELSQEEMTKEISSLKDSLTEKDAFYHKEMESLRTISDRDIWDLRMKLQKLTESSYDKQQQMEEKHREDMERSRVDYEDRIRELEAQIATREAQAGIDLIGELERNHKEQLQHIQEHHRLSMERLREELESDKEDAVEEVRLLVTANHEYAEASLKEQINEYASSLSQCREELETLGQTLSFRDESLRTLRGELEQSQELHRGSNEPGSGQPYAASLPPSGLSSSQFSLASSTDSQGSRNSQDRFYLPENSGILENHEEQRGGNTGILGKVFGGGWFAPTKTREGNRRGSTPLSNKKAYGS